MKDLARPVGTLKRFVVGAFSLSVFMLSIQLPAQSVSDTQLITIASGVPLHVRVTHTSRLRRGAMLEGQLTGPVYVYDRLVLPVGSVVRGSVSGLVPPEKKLRVQAILNGDVTPLHIPIVNFNTVRVGGQDVGLTSEALLRSTQRVNFTPGGPHPTLFQQGKKLIRDRIQSTRDAVFAPGKKDRVLKLLYSQLPYHPQNIWAGSQFIADLTTPAQVSLPAQPETAIIPASASSLDRLNVTARLTTPLDSDSTKKGDTVSALVTDPVFDSNHKLILPESTELEGTVLQSKPSRSLGRNGQLHFVFRGVKRSSETNQQVRGTLQSAEGSQSQNLSVDQEGTVKSHPDKNRFVAPLILAALTAAGHDRDRDGNGFGRDTVASNGFGLIARVIALTVNDRNVATGFGAYSLAKSVYFRFLSRGHAVSFPKDTVIQIQLATHR